MSKRTMIKHGHHQFPVSSFDIDDSDNDNCKKWKAGPVRPIGFVLTNDQTESEMELSYVQEVHEVKWHILDGMNIIKWKNTEKSITVIDIFNVFMPTTLIFDIMTFMNMYLIRK